MAANFNKRRGLYIASNDETDQQWQEFHQQLSSTPQPEPEDDFPQLELPQRGGRPSVSEPADPAPGEPSASPSRPLPPVKPLPKPPPKGRPPSSSLPVPPAPAPPQSTTDDAPLPVNPRTKSPMRPQGIRANGARGAMPLHSTLVAHF